MSRRHLVLVHSCRSKNHTALPALRLSAISLAVLAGCTPLSALADCSVGGSISSQVSGVQSWSAGDCSITSSGTISGGTPALNTSGTVGTLTNNGFITGDEIGLRVSGAGSSLAEVVNNGQISAIYTSGIQNSGTIGTLGNAGTITSGYYGINNAGSITNLSNSGTIHGNADGIFNGANKSIGAITNAVGATINGATGIVNNGTIGALANSGLIGGGGGYGLTNVSGATIGQITNNASATINGNTGIYSNGGIGTLVNNGTISGNSNGMQNDASGTIGLLSNTGWITGLNNGLLNTGTITSLVNSGTISDNFLAGLYNGGVINTLTNTIGGLITGAVGLANLSGSIGVLNNSGTISGASFAIYNDAGATIGGITNSGLIMGGLYNASATGWTINGGTGNVFGTLTGASGGLGSADIGTIDHSVSNLTFGTGNLLLNDNINAGSFTVNNVGATLQVNNQVSISGNYHQGATAALVSGVNPGATTSGISSDTGFGRLIVSGTAVIDPGSRVTLKPVSAYAFAQGQRYVVVTATTAGTNYNVASQTYAATGYSGTVFGSVVPDGSNSNLLLTLGSSGGGSGGGSGGSSSTQPNLSATTPNAVSAISGLFNYNGVNPSLLNVFNASAALGSTADANRAGAQLSPASNATAAAQVSSAPTQTVVDVAGAHVDGLRIAQLEGGSGVSTGEGSSKFALWGQAFGGKARQSQRDNVSGYDADYNGLLIGGDSMVSEAWRVGGLLSYANTSVASNGDNNGSSVHFKSYGLIGYAGYTSDAWYLDLSGGVVKHQYDTARVIDFSGFSGAANASYNGRQYVLSAQAGYPIRLGGAMEGAILTPIAGLNYSKLYQNGYTESGGNGAALTVQSSSSSSLKSELGAKLERSFSTAYGSLAPSVQLGWRHEYRNTRLQTLASYAADSSGTTAFTGTGAKPVTDTGVLALAATLTRSERMTVTARYRLETGGGYTAQTADVRLRYQF